MLGEPPTFEAVFSIIVYPWSQLFGQCVPSFLLLPDFQTVCVIFLDFRICCGLEHL